MSHKFDKDVPIPTGKFSASRYGFAHMAVGDSFTGEKNATPAAAQYKKRTPGWDYVSRKEGDVVRIWRTA